MKILFLIGALILLAACVPKSELDNAQRQINELQEKNGVLGAENARLKAQLEQKSALPLTMALRKALMGPGYVAVFNTTVKATVSALATLTSKALGTTKRFEIHVNPAVAYELGHREGAVLEEGDVIILENQNYSPLTFTVNNR